MPYICNQPSTSIVGTWVDDGTKGSEVGQCISLIKHQCPALKGKITSAWKKGSVAVKGASLARGTAIAVFSTAGKPLHAAIYIGQDASGIQVWDQYLPSAHNPAGAKVGRHTIRFNNTTSSHYNGDNYYTVE